MSSAHKMLISLKIISFAGFQSLLIKIFVFCTFTFLVTSDGCQKCGFFNARLCLDPTQSHIGSCLTKLPILTSFSSLRSSSSSTKNYFERFAYLTALDRRIVYTKKLNKTYCIPIIFSVIICLGNV